MEQRLGYRVRPSFNWQRERYGTMELILGIANDGVAGVPGALGIYAASPAAWWKISIEHRSALFLAGSPGCPGLGFFFFLPGNRWFLTLRAFLSPFAIR